jgi:diaminopimelate epimerase
MSPRFPFSKYHGTGNDFIVLDEMAGPLAALAHQPDAFFAALCHRRFGIGADGVIHLRPHPVADFEMIYRNADGSVGSLCGNGSRCAVRAFADLGYGPQAEPQAGQGPLIQFWAYDGLHQAALRAAQVAITLRPPAPDALRRVEADVWFVDTGSPHQVVWLDGLGDHAESWPALDANREATLHDFPITTEGPRRRYDPRFAPGGTNVNFAIRHAGGLAVRTWERGVEAETLSCGTGVVATAWAHHQLADAPWPIQITTPGGSLSVDYEPAQPDQPATLWLIGPAVRVFDGVWAGEGVA